MLLVAANLAERALQPVGAVKLAISLLPMVGVLAAAWAILRGLWGLGMIVAQRRYR